MPQYRYAFDANQQIVDVLLLPQNRDEIGELFSCVGCGNPLIAKTKAEKKQKHFAHKTAVPCRPETYLHRLAKTVFEQVYLQCLADNEPFFVEISHPKVCSQHRALLGHRCNLGEVAKEHDLTQYYDGVRVEKRDGCFIPDLLLFNRSDESKKIYIEIAVTHFLSEEKVESDNRIIEIPIETEEDIEKIRARRLTATDASFVNLGRPAAAVPDAECACASDLFYFFMIFKSGKCFMDEATLNEVQSKMRKLAGSIAYTRLVKISGDNILRESGQVFSLLLEQAQAKGFPVRNCLLCRYAAQNWEWFHDALNGRAAPVFCKVKRQPCGTNAAVSCEKFRLHRTS